MSKQAQASEMRSALYIVFLAMIAAIPAMATDMYLAAMPTIASQWHVPDSRVGLSLVLWFVAFSLFLLVWGPLSDKYGRRPVLLAGLALFVVSTFACSFSQNVWQLIAFRILQGIGAAGPSSMAMAICRDKYEGLQRKRALAYIGIILTVAPAVAPSIGAVLLAWFNWRAIFLTQGALGAVTLAVSIRYRETAAERVSGHFLYLLSRYRHVVANRRYLFSNTSMGLILAPFYAFIAFSSIVYIQIFGLSERAFGILFGVNGADVDGRRVRLHARDEVLLGHGSSLGVSDRLYTGGRGYPGDRQLALSCLCRFHVCDHVLLWHEPTAEQPSDSTAGSPRYRFGLILHRLLPVHGRRRLHADRHRRLGPSNLRVRPGCPNVANDSPADLAVPAADAQLTRACAVTS